MKKIIFGLVACCTQLVFCQDHATIPTNSTLWLKGKSQTDGIDDKTIPSYNFNFNPVFFPNDAKDPVHKNVLSDKYSLFVVFRSDYVEELNLINLKLNGKTTAITNKKVFNEKENIYRKVDAKQGMLLTYIVSRELKGRKKSSLLVENLSRPNAPEGNRNDIMELICYPRLVSDLERKKIESYLSIKHGISLLGEVDYIRSDEQKIWDSKENSPYTSRVTGIGRDEQWGLYQKQSGNAQRDGFYIGLGEIYPSNGKNKNEMPEGTFLLWADNDGPLIMKSDKKGPASVKKMKRIWKMQCTNERQSTPPSTQVMIDKTAFSIDGDKEKENPGKKDDFVWLAIDRNSSPVFDYHHAEYYKQSKDENGRLYFDDVVWDSDNSGSDTYTFITGPDFFVDYEISETDCDQELGVAKLSIVGGRPPFSINLTSPSKTQSHTTEGRFFEIPDFDGTFAVSVSDIGQRIQKDTLRLQNMKKIAVVLEEQWYLDRKSKQAIIIPQIENPEQQQLTLTWKSGDKVLSTDRQFTATEEGDYLLKVSNATGCEKELFFKVNSATEAASGSWTLYPNPARLDENFSIRFDLEKESEVSVAFFDFSNKLIKNKNLGKLKNFEYSESLSTIGTYLILVTIDGKAASAKIIIR